MRTPITPFTCAACGTEQYHVAWWTHLLLMLLLITAFIIGAMLALVHWGAWPALVVLAASIPAAALLEWRVWRPLPMMPLENAGKMRDIARFMSAIVLVVLLLWMLIEATAHLP